MEAESVNETSTTDLFMNQIRDKAREILSAQDMPGQLALVEASNVLPKGKLFVVTITAIVFDAHGLYSELLAFLLTQSCLAKSFEECGTRVDLRIQAP